MISDIISEIKKFLICHGQILDGDIRDDVGCRARVHCPSPTIFPRFVLYQKEAIPWAAGVSREHLHSAAFRSLDCIILV